MPKVNLRGTFGYGRPPRYYGPGEGVEVPEGLAQALGLKEVEEGQGAVEQADAPSTEGEQGDSRLSLVPPAHAPDPMLVRGLGADLAEQLALAGFNSEATVRAASDDDLLALPGIGSATLRKIRAAVP